MKHRQNKLDPFAARLADWEAEGKTLAEMQAQLAQDGCKVSAGQLSVYLSSQRDGRLQDRLFTLIASGGFYPSGVTSAAGRLGFYAAQFPIVEVDSTFYGPPNERVAHLWAERTPPGFVFDVKAFALLTGHGAPPERLTPDLQALVPPPAPPLIRSRWLHMRARRG